MSSLSHENVMGWDPAVAGWSDLAWSHLWQTTAVMVVVALLAISLRRKPHWVYLLCLLVLLKGVTPPLLSSPVSLFGWLAPTGMVEQMAVRVEPTRIATASPTHPFGGATVPSEFVLPNSGGSLTEPFTARVHPPIESQNTRVPPAKPWPWRDGLLCGWLLGVAVMLLGWWRQSRKLARSRAAWTEDESLQAMVIELATRLGVRRFVQVQVSATGEGPGVVGWWGTTIVIPISLLRTDAIALEPILAHELIHIRRGDAVHALLQRVAQVVWWFHPLAWWINRECSRARERCCDEEVLASRVCLPQTYARCLVGLLERQVERRSVRLALEMRSFDVTKQRLEGIMRRGSQFCHLTPRWCWVTLALLALIVLPGRAFIAAQPKAGDQQTVDERAAIPRSVQDSLAESMKELGHDIRVDDKQADQPWSIVNLNKRETARAAMPLVEKFHDLEWFNAQASPLEDADVARIAKLTRLKSIMLNGTKISDAALVHLRGMTQLEQLLLDETGITDAGLKQLQSLPNLKTLTLMKTAVSDEGVRALALFPKLEHLRLDNTQVTTAGLMPLKTMATLKSLSATQPLPIGMQKFAGATFQLELTELTEAAVRNIGDTTESALLMLTLKGPLITPDSLNLLQGFPSHKQLVLTFIDCPVTDADLAVLGKLPTLANLTINSATNSKITDTGLAHLRELKQLTHLYFDTQHITDEGVRHLAAIPSLQFLHLMMLPQVTDAGVRHLASLKELTHLSLFGSRITDASLLTLASLPKLTSLMLDQTAITDAGLAHLEQLPNLGSVTATGTKITQAGIDRLKTRLPKVTVLDRLPPTPERNADAAKSDARQVYSPLPLPQLSPASQSIIDRLRAMNVSVEMQPGYSQYSQRQHREYVSRQLPLAVTVHNPDDLAGVLLLLSRLPELEVLALNHCRFGTAEREQLKRLITLHSLQVFSGEFGDAELACLAELPELNVLHLSQTLVTDEGWVRLPVFSKLYSLHVTNSRFTDRMIEWLERQPQLETVGLLQSKFTTAGANRIAALPNLVEAQFEEERMPDRIPNPEINATFHLKKCDAEIVERIRKLGIVGNRLDFVRCGVGLNLSSDAITDDSLKALAPIADLVVDLHLVKTAITAAGLVEVGRLPHLASLGLHHNPNLTGTMLASHLSPLFVRTPVVSMIISSAETPAEKRRRNRQQFGLCCLILDGLALEQADLAALKPAMFLAISNGQLTDDKLKGFLSSGTMRLFLNNEPITDAGLLNLAESKYMSLRLGGSKVTEAGIAALRKRNPNILVTLAPAQPEPLE